MTEQEKRRYEDSFCAQDRETVLYAILEMTETVDDPAWIAARLSALAGHSDKETAALAITCFGHLARLHGTVGDYGRVCALLEAKRNIPELRGSVENAFDDFAVFLKD